MWQSNILKNNTALLRQAFSVSKKSHVDTDTMHVSNAQIKFYGK